MSHATVDNQHYIIRHTLADVGAPSLLAEQLLHATAAIQQQAATAINPDGLGIFGIDSHSHRDIWDNYLAFNPDLASRVRGIASQHGFLRDPDSELVTNQAYATAISWVMYRRAGALREDGDTENTASEHLSSHRCRQLAKLWLDTFCKGTLSTRSQTTLSERFACELQECRGAVFAA